jgi:hypothetical protein
MGGFQEPQGIKGWRFPFSDNNLRLLNALTFSDILCNTFQVPYVKSNKSIQFCYTPIMTDKTGLNMMHNNSASFPAATSVFNLLYALL